MVCNKGRVGGEFWRAELGRGKGQLTAQIAGHQQAVEGESGVNFDVLIWVVGGSIAAQMVGQ